MRISYSALESFISCPAKYKYQNIDKIKTPKSKEAVFGTLIHECLKALHNPSLAAPLTEDALLKQFTDKWNSDLYQDQQEEAFTFHQGIEILKNYRSENRNLTSKIIDLETSFTVALGDHLIAGRIDRIDKLPDGIFEVIDYKTARKMPSQEMVDSNLQLSIYHLGLLNRWPALQKKQVCLSLYFVRHGEKISTFRTGQQLEESKEKILDLISQIEKSDFQPKSNPLCNWCQYQKQCPLFRHKFITDQPAIEIKDVIKEYFEVKVRQSTDVKKMAELKKLINQYCDDNQLERVFGDEGFITRQTQQRFAYNSDNVRSVLEPLNKWEEILTIDNTRLKKIVASLPQQVRQEVENSKELVKEFKVLTTGRS